MPKTNLIAIAALIAFILTPAVASAETPSVSYSAKKQGRVIFQENVEKENTILEKGANEAASPAEIEPAAGGDTDVEENAQNNSLAHEMKLPRKN